MIKIVLALFTVGIKKVETFKKLAEGQTSEKSGVSVGSG